MATQLTQDVAKRSALELRSERYLFEKKTKVEYYTKMKVCTTSLPILLPCPVAYSCCPVSINDLVQALICKSLEESFSCILF